MSRAWRVRGGTVDTVLELDPADRSPMEGDARRRLNAFLYEARHAGGNAERVLVELYSALFGRVPPNWDYMRRDIGRRATFFDAIERDIGAAAERGRLRVRDGRTRHVVVPLEAPDEAPLGPNAPEDDTAPTSWIGLSLVDQDQKPVPNRAYRIQTADGSTIDGTLDSNGSAIVKDLKPGNCQVWCPYVEPHDEATIVAQPGDHISGIAQQYGFDDYTTVWGHANNADLAGQRDVAHVINDGDSVYVPAYSAQAANKPTGAKHVFSIKVSPLKLRVKLLGVDMKPLANATGAVDGTTLASDGDGVLELPIDKLSRSSVLTLDALDTPLAIGALNVIDDATPAGWKARLFGLGFLVDPEAEDDEVTFSIQDFQAEHSLDLSGDFDDATKSKLKEVYGV